MNPGEGLRSLPLLERSKCMFPYEILNDDKEPEQFELPFPKTEQELIARVWVEYLNNKEKEGNNEYVLEG